MIQIYKCKSHSIAGDGTDVFEWEDVPTGITAINPKNFEMLLDRFRRNPDERIISGPFGHGPASLKFEGPKDYFQFKEELQALMMTHLLELWKEAVADNCKDDDKNRALLKQIEAKAEERRELIDRAIFRLTLAMSKAFVGTHHQRHDALAGAMAEISELSNLVAGIECIAITHLTDPDIPF